MTPSNISNTNDTICAVATATGGALGIIRISGKDAITIADNIFTPSSKPHVSLAQRHAGTVTYGHICGSDGQVVDDVLVSIFRAPHSYTGEDSVEISCHGSSYILQKTMQLLIDNGCRAAGPGEYTLRAFLNGKMDLSQAEAVADLISSSNQASHRLALSQLKGHVRTALETLRERLLRLTSLLELELDFSDHDDLVFADRSELLSLARSIEDHVAALARTYHIGKAVKEGIPVAIVGKTNVGKSTLLNHLVGEDRALVSDVHGTTRDSIEETTLIGGLTFRFVDTAGLRHTDDVVEQMGIERTWQKLDEALLVLWVVDRWPTQEETDEMAAHCRGKHVLLVFNKADLHTPPTDPLVADGGDTGAVRSLPPHPISAKTGQGLDALEAAIRQAVDIPEIHEADVVITSARQYDLLTAAAQELQRVVDGLQSDLPSDLVAEDLRMVLYTLGDATGVERITPQATLNNIFSSFCIGK